VTEAGFAFELGAEKFFDINCRYGGFAPCCTVQVATLRALKMHGGVPLGRISEPNVEAVERGLENLEKHVENIRKFEQGCVVAINHFPTDTADEIAYINHDLDDGLGSGLLVPERLEDVALWRETLRAVREQLGDVPERVLRAQVVVALINRLVTDLIETVARRVDTRGLASVEAVRGCPERLVQFSPELEKPKRELKKFLYDELYQHPQVLAMNERAVGILGDLFAAFRSDPGRLPDHVRARIPADGEARAIADYVAGMTDRFAMDEHEKLGARRG